MHKIKSGAKILGKISLTSSWLSYDKYSKCLSFSSINEVFLGAIIEIVLTKSLKTAKMAKDTPLLLYTE